MALALSRHVATRFTIFVAFGAGCVPGPDFQSVTITDEAKLASLVFTGTTVPPTTTTALESYANYTVDVTVDRYLRGCGPALVALSGFADVSCIISPPQVGQRLIAFACKEGDALAKMNVISDYTGAKIEEDLSNHIEDVGAALGLPGDGSTVEECASAVLTSSHTCQKMPSKTTVTTVTTTMSATAKESITAIGSASTRRLAALGFVAFLTMSLQLPF